METSQNIFQKEKQFDCISQEKAYSFRFDAIQSFMKSGFENESMAIRALKLTNWNLNLAIQKCNYDDSFMDKICTSWDPEPTEESLMCEICYCPFDRENEGYALPCNHYFCLYCYGEHVKNAFLTNVHGSKCPNKECNYLLLDTTYAKFLSSEDYERYQRYIMSDYVNNCWNLAWCAAPLCTQILKYQRPEDKDSEKNMTCPTCTFCFCPKCRQEGHYPITCDWMKQWIDLTLGKFAELSEVWIKTHTKPCPKCKSAIEKTTGCMHIHCNKCKHDFCWLCLGPWKAHTKCTTFKPSDDPSATQTKKQMQKFSYYAEKYFAHQKAVAHAVEKRKNAIENFKLLCEVYKIHPSQAKFLDSALQGVIESRRQISLTYCLPYFIDFKLAEEKEMYEFHQNQLSSNLDLLDKLTDDLDDQNKLNNFFDEASVLEFLKKVEHSTQTLGVYFSRMMSYLTGDFMKSYAAEIEGFIEMENMKEIVYSTFWDCPKCGVSQPNEAKICEACQTPRPAHLDQKMK